MALCRAEDGAGLLRCQGAAFWCVHLDAIDNCCDVAGHHLVGLGGPEGSPQHGAGLVWSSGLGIGNRSGRQVLDADFSVDQTFEYGYQFGTSPLRYSQRGKLLVPSARTGPVRIRLQARLEDAPEGARLALSVDEHSAGFRAVESGWRDYEWEIPAASWSEGTNVVSLSVTGGRLQVRKLHFVRH